MKRGCKDCKYCKCYPGGYWDPDDYECVCGYKAFEGMTQEQIDDTYERAWINGEEWDENEEPICPAYEDAPTEDDEYWEKYAYEERYKER